MLYYLGKGTEFKKEDCKEYKTLKNALAAAAKDEALTVWDENGVVASSMADNVPDGASNTNLDGSINTYDENGNPAGIVEAETEEEMAGNEKETVVNGGEEDKAENVAHEPEDVNNGANTRVETGEDDIITPSGTTKVNIVCDGALNLRRSPEWGNDNICGRAVRGQSYYVKEIHTVDGKKMVRTIDNLYLSGQSEHVQFEMF